MIRYALVCDQRHAFESWFANSATYDRQVKRGLNHGAAGGGNEKARRCVRIRADARGTGIVATVGI